MAINNPNIPDYKPFYIQKGGSCFDTREQWGFLTKSNPFPAMPNPKTPYSNNWKDAHGDDDFVEEMFYESFTFDVQFYIRTNGADAADEIRQKMAQFFSFIKDGYLEVYDSYTALGRRKVRYDGYKEDTFKSRGKGSDAWAICIFSVTFKVNDPVTFMKYDTDTQRITDEQV